ncbi:MAG: GTA-gp10 family protein [Gammaproteobacteria bacterium]|nr:GTA-gp10 family protein [Gammaproteobacteria bacterium]
MGELVKDPGPGACSAQLGGQSRVLKIRLAEIERFEDRHARGFYDFFDGLRGESFRPTVGQIRDLIALALVGGGMKDEEADAVMREEGPEKMIPHLHIAESIMMATLIPKKEERDLLDPDAGGDKPGGPPKKKRARSKSAD